MQEKLISINNSSESLEKSIGIMYTNILSNRLFYDSYDTTVFYGDNLPKTSKNIIAIGTVGFYNKHMSKFDFGYDFSIDDLWNNRVCVLDELVKKSIISVRNACKLKENYLMFSTIISMLPVSYLYSDFYNNLLEKTKLVMPNVSFRYLDLFKNYEKIINEIDEFSELYKIYGLQLNGDISIFNFRLPQNEHYTRAKIHLIKSISKSIVLSGNIAVLLSQIKNSIPNNHIIGYRCHKNNRFSRQIALDQILNIYPDTVMEPKNELYNSYFDKYKIVTNNEERANEVAADAYYYFIKENAKTLKIDILKG